MWDTKANMGERCPLCEQALAIDESAGHGSQCAQQLRVSLRQAQEARASDELALATLRAEAATLRDVLQQRNARIGELQAQLLRAAAHNSELAQHQASIEAELNARVQARVLELEQTRAQHIQTQLAHVRSELREELEHTYALQLAERDEQLRTLHTHITQLKERADQGSQQRQGEANEQVIEQRLR